jgi:two-component system, LytTR family, sensor kinase
MNRTVLVLIHIGYWLLYLLLMLLFFIFMRIGVEPGKGIFENNKYYIFFGAFTVVPAVFGFYTFYTVLFSRFLSRKKILLLFLIGFLTAYVSGFIGVVFMTLLSWANLGLPMMTKEWRPAFELSIVTFIIALLNGGMGLIIRGFIRWYIELKWKEELSKKNFETELALVKSQLDPHFLFNTINNIDVLIGKDADKASAYLNKLSEMMRFMLYETKTDQIPLQKELDYLQRYIDLQKIRHADPEFVILDLQGEAEDLEIAPMVLIPLVENAFKYADGVRGKDAIQIQILIEGPELHFNCTNRYLSVRPQTRFGGLGNSLMAKRLELLYPQQAQLSFIDNGTQYAVNLNLKLAQHALHHH